MVESFTIYHFTFFHLPFTQREQAALPDLETFNLERNPLILNINGK